MKVGQLRGNKSKTVYNTDSYVISLAASHDGTYFLSGHYDSSIYHCNTESLHYKKIITSKTIPYALGAGKHIVVGGNDAKVNFYDTKGNFLSRIDYST